MQNGYMHYLIMNLAPLIKYYRSYFKQEHSNWFFTLEVAGIYESILRPKLFLENNFQFPKCKWHQTIINTNHSSFLFFMLLLEYIEYALCSVTVSDMYCVSYMLQLKFHIISVWQLCIMYYEKQATFYIKDIYIFEKAEKVGTKIRFTRFRLPLQIHLNDVWSKWNMKALKMKNISEAICKWNKEHFFHFIIINNFGIHTENVLPMPYS